MMALLQNGWSVGWLLTQKSVAVYIATNGQKASQSVAM